MEDGEDVRFWITLQNDAEQEDTFVVKGCRGTARFRIIAVKIGFLKRPDWRPEDITAGFKNGTATFDLPPASDGKRIPSDPGVHRADDGGGRDLSVPHHDPLQTDPSMSDTSSPS